MKITLLPYVKENPVKSIKKENTQNINNKYNTNNSYELPSYNSSVCFTANIRRLGNRDDDLYM